MKDWRLTCSRWLKTAIVLLAFMMTMVSPIYAHHHHHKQDDASVATPSLANTVILIIRHAEKPDSGSGLTPAGQQRARAYIHYFQSYRVDGQPLHLNHLFAAADSKNSQRPRLTVTPLSHAFHLPIDSRFRDDDFQSLADALQTKSYGHEILICWHHGEIPDLLKALGADPKALLPHKKWPKQVYGWMFILHYDAKGHLSPNGIQRINEHLMRDDTAIGQ